LTRVARGDIWLVDFGEPVGHEQGYRRPALVVSADQFNRSRAGLVIVVPITRTRRGIASHVEVEPGDSGLAETSYAKVEDLKSVSVQRLVKLHGTASPECLHQVKRIVSLLLAL
jgi:mRNA interferase MazF